MLTVLYIISYLVGVFVAGYVLKCHLDTNLYSKNEVTQYIIILSLLLSWIFAIGVIICLSLQHISTCIINLLKKIDEMVDSK